MKAIKKLTAYILIGLIIVSTVIGMLAIWDIIDVQQVMKKVFSSLFLVFISSVIVLFIFSVLFKDSEKNS